MRVSEFHSGCALCAGAEILSEENLSSLLMGTDDGYQLREWDWNEVVLGLVSWTATSIIYTSVFWSDRND